MNINQLLDPIKWLHTSPWEDFLWYLTFCVKNLFQLHLSEQKIYINIHRKYITQTISCVQVYSVFSFTKPRDLPSIHRKRWKILVNTQLTWPYIFKGLEEG